ncbi:1-acyl-sn-glycerol-3-phosphate acyltransferase [Terrimonas sp. NA20]|uniref:1-acyl-sn-glycerol-3-phosphate acyltransferase n=1 Tax=Terrimonas ginsenosidimutans TaxID=2908004 RepID=A0ABS9KRI9_9BACT|nr:1-acyl-sn-glycerol-3-phosphate acyltransferase [Terrimonas ginsenosidimutans]MCG2614923.1 1-acyl-sn-glycerol-3-phosphate acyltransferase [Terrimonas ginsenosidimutans]
MLYAFLKILVKLSRPLYFRSIRINRPELLLKKGPLLICSNHPNSFLDAVLLDTLFEQPIWSLARGDVFRNPFLTRILTAIRILPVYRVSEGVENLSTNYETFDACKEIFRQNGLVLIFSEGLCINEWHLRPLKKGTARLAMSSWSEGIPLEILPVGINYNSFSAFGKDLVINIGEPVSLSQFNLSGSEGQQIQQFNVALTQRLQPLVYEIAPEDIKTRVNMISRPASIIRKTILAIPASVGWLLHQPQYLLMRSVARKKSVAGHYDSILAALLFLSYPFYLLLIALLLFLLSGKAALMPAVMLLPVTGWCLIQSGFTTIEKPAHA